MTAVVPSSLALTSISDGSSMTASPVRNNFSSVQTAVNALVAVLALATTKGDILVATASGTYDRLPVGTTNGQQIVADSTQTLGVKWSGGSYRKTTVKAVNTTVAATDLLNGEITVAAGLLGTTGVLRLTAWGDFLNNSGGAVPAPRFQLVLGGTTLLDTATTSTVGASAARAGWRIVCEIQNAGAANAQVASLQLLLGLPAQGAAGFATFFSIGNGLYEGASSFLAKAEGTNSGLAVNTALAQLLVLNVINGSASASYETKLLGALVEVI